MGAGWALYLIEAENGFLYTGITTDLERRFSEHRGGTGAKFFRRSPAKKVLWSESGLTRGMALKLEYRLKRLPRASKLEIARTGNLEKLKKEIRSRVKKTKR
jgi:putative endonuclease